MSTLNHKTHKPEIDLYKRIAAVINPRLDLDTKQKTEIIHACFEAARLSPKENGLVDTTPSRDNPAFVAWQNAGNTLANWIRKRTHD